MNQALLDREEKLSEAIYIHAAKEASKKFNLKIGDKTIKYILDKLGSFENFFDPEDEVMKELREKSFPGLFNGLKNTIDLKRSYKLLAYYTKMDIDFTTIKSPDYPKALLELDNPPCILYYYGDIKNIDIKKNLSIVGTRMASLYGKHSTRALVQSLKNYDAGIVSGLAMGIDSEAHISALENQLQTIAVLGAGLLKLSHEKQNNLVKALRQNPQNLIISEFEPSESAQTWTYPQRNRIISALSKATMVIEAGASSGALITADFSKKLGRKIFALPGDLNKASFKGSNKLLSENLAEGLYSVKQIIDEIDLKEKELPAKKSSLGLSKSNLKNKVHSKRQKLNAISKEILDYITKSADKEAVNFDLLMQKLKLNQISLSSNLSILEINGFIRKDSGNLLKLQKS